VLETSQEASRTIESRKLSTFILEMRHTVSLCEHAVIE